MRRARAYVCAPRRATATGTVARAARRRRRRSRVRRQVGEWLQASRRHIKALLAAFVLLLCLVVIGVHAHATSLTNWSFPNTVALCCLAVGVLVASVATLGLCATARARADIAVCVYEACEARGGPQDVEMTPGQASAVLSSSSSPSFHAYLSGWRLRAYSGQPV